MILHHLHHVVNWPRRVSVIAIFLPWTYILFHCCKSIYDQCCTSRHHLLCLPWAGTVTGFLLLIRALSRCVWNVVKAGKWGWRHILWDVLFRSVSCHSGNGFVTPRTSELFTIGCDGYRSWNDGSRITFPRLRVDPSRTVSLSVFREWTCDAFRLIVMVSLQFDVCRWIVEHTLEIKCSDRCCCIGLTIPSFDSSI